MIHSLFFIENLLSQKELGYKVAAIFTQSAVVKEKYENSIIILPEKYLGILTDLIEVDLIDEVLFLKNRAVPNEVRDTVTTCEELGVTFRLRYSDLKKSFQCNQDNFCKRKFPEFCQRTLSFICTGNKKKQWILICLCL